MSESERPSLSDRMVVHYTDGRVVKGIGVGFAPDAMHFSLRPLGHSEPQTVWLRELKAVFFVRFFDGRPFYREQKRPSGAAVPYEGQRIVVKFGDGEELRGWTTEAVDGPHGFTLVPYDAESNNERVFVVRGSGLASVEPEVAPPPLPFVRRK
jgi:hypothetical protein